MLKKLLFVVLFVYFFVLIAIYVIQFILFLQGLEFRPCVDSFRIFWTFILSLIVGGFVLFYIFLTQMKNNSKERFFAAKWMSIAVIYIIAGLFSLLVLVLGGFFDVPKEEQLESGYLRITENTGWTAIYYYYCEPISQYVRKPITTHSWVMDPEYE